MVWWAVAPLYLRSQVQDKTSAAADRIEQRFIPARAGNRIAGNDRDAVTAVHPRACGEQCDGTDKIGKKVGSSPRVRGTGCGSLLGFRYIRFIPARTGNSFIKPAVHAVAAVHPRACGEQIQQVLWRRHDDGSSPRVRGTADSTVRKR